LFASPKLACSCSPTLLSLAVHDWKFARGTDALPLNGRRKTVMRVTQGLLPLLAMTYAATIVINIVMRIVIVRTTSSLTFATDLGLCPKSNLPDFFCFPAATLQPRHWKVKGIVIRDNHYVIGSSSRSS
jgi:hypothetical protein